MLELDKFIDGILNENVTCDNIELSRQVSDQWLDKKNKLKLNGYLHEKHWMPLKKTYNYINHSYQTSILWAKASFLNDFFRTILCQQIVIFKFEKTTTNGETGHENCSNGTVSQEYRPNTNCRCVNLWHER